MTGIYQIQSKVKPEKIYIGSAININKRWYSHIYRLKNNIHKSKKLQNHFNKYGIDDLMFVIIENFEFTSKEHLLSREQYFIDTLNPIFNFSKVARSPMLGLKFTKEHCDNLSKSLKGRTSPMKGKHLSDEAIQRLVIINTGRHPSEESKMKMRNAKLGKVASKETKAKMSLAHIGNKSFSGRNLSEEHKNNIRKGQPDKSGPNNPRFNVPVSDETRLKMSISNKKRWAIRKFEKNLSTKYE